MAEGLGRDKSEARCVADGGISNTVEVRGFSKNTSQEVLEMYFENLRRSGGGDVEEVQIRDGVASITFKDAEVAQRVISRNHHQVDGQTLTVTLLHPSPPKSYYKNRILIQGLNNAVTEEMLTKFLETMTKTEVREFLYGEEKGNVVVTLSDNIDIGQLRKTFQERRFEGAVLKVLRVSISNCIFVQNLQSSTSHDAILFYFENKRSGGGDVERVELKEEGYCLVYFEDPSVIDRVLSKTHNIDGADVEVHLHHECLGRRSSRNKSDPYLRISILGNKDSSILEEENTDNQSNEETSSSISSNPDKESDFVELQEWQENDGKNCVLLLWIKYKRASEMMVVKDIKKIPCSGTFHLYWNYYTKTNQGQLMLDDIVKKYNCSVAVCTEDEDLFIFEISEKIFDQESDVVHFIHTVLDNVYKCAQQFLYLDILLVDQRMQGDVLELVKQREELDGARIELMGQKDNDAIYVICTEKDKKSVLHVVTEIIHNVRERFENQEEIISLDHKWQKVLKHFGYIQELVDKYPKVTIILDEAKPAIMLKDASDQSKAAILLKGPRDQSKPAADRLNELVGIAQFEIKEDIFSPGCQFEIFIYPEMCEYIDNIIMELSIVWIPDQLTKKIHIFSKKSDKIKGIDKFIKGCVQERVYPLPKDQSAQFLEIFSSLEKLKKKHTGKIVINLSHKDLRVTTADEIFESVDATVLEIINKQTVDPFQHPSPRSARPKAKAAPLSPPDQHMDPVKIQGFTATVDPQIQKRVRKVKKKQNPVGTVEQKSGVTSSHTESSVQFKAVTSQQHEIFVKETLEIKELKISAENSIFGDKENIEHRIVSYHIIVSQTEFLALQSLEIYSKWRQKFKFTLEKETLYIQGAFSDLNDEIKEEIEKEIASLRRKQKSEITYEPPEKMQLMLVVDEAKSDQLLLVWDDDNKQVLVYSDSYDEMQKFKHKVEFKMGKKKLTGRRGKRFANQEDTMPLPYLDEPVEKKTTRSFSFFSWSQDATNVEAFKTLEGIVVKVYEANILKLDVDCIVNAANDNLQHGGGIALVIAKGAGPEIDREGSEILKIRGRIKVGEQCVTTAGNLPYDCIIHTVGPRWSDYFPHDARSTGRCERDLFSSIIGCFFEAENRNLKSIALPAISSGIFAVPRDICTEQYVKAVIHYSKTRTGKCLQEIHFIERLPDIVKDMQVAFKRHLIGDGNARHIVKGGDQTTAINDHAGRDSGNNENDRIRKTYFETFTEDDGQTIRKQNPASPVCPEIEQKIIKKQKFCVYKPNKNLEVNIHTTDITKMIGVEAIVCSDDRRGTGLGAVASALLKIGKSKYESAKKKAFEKEVHFGDVIATDGGDSNFHLVIHAVMPSSKDKMLAQECKEIVRKCYDKILDDINNWQKASLALPLIGTDFVELGYEGSAMLFLNSLEVFCNRSMMLNIKVIHIVDKDEHITEKIADVFIKYTETVRKHLLATHSRMPKPAQYPSSHTGSVKPQGVPLQVKPKSPVSGALSKENCPICLTEVKSPKTLNCGHTFCLKCIEIQFGIKPVCPMCGAMHQKIYGDQPDGVMKVTVMKFGLKGFEKSDTIKLEYLFPSGRQGPNHPNPGKFYGSFTKSAYLPDTVEGRKVCELLKVAFERRLIFTFGRSNWGLDYVLKWNDIHHKTDFYGKYGYPDPGYLKRVQEQLAAKGVTEADLKHETVA